MQIHLIADEKSVVLAGEIQKFLEPFFKSCGVEFVIGEEVFKHQNYWFWDEIFSVTDAYLSDKKQEHRALFLINGINEHNWFAAQSPHSSRMAFVHTEAEKDYGFSAFHRVAYHVLAVLVRSVFFGNLNDSFEHYHMQTIGCMNDFTSNKAEVVSKIRSGYICPKCLEKMATASNRHPQKMAFLYIAIQVFAKIREKLNHIDLTALLGRKNVELTVDRAYNFTVQVGGQDILLELSKGWHQALFLFLLDHREGFLVNDLDKNKVLRERLATYMDKFISQSSISQNLEDLHLWAALGQCGAKVSPHFSRMRDKVKASLKAYPDLVDLFSITSGRNVVKRLLLSDVKINRKDLEPLSNSRKVA